MNNIKTSVAMATYNGEKFIEKQLKSIICQTLVPDEIIIIDDASTDNTYKLIVDFLGKNYKGNVVIKRHEKNYGYRATFFEAISNSTGNIIFLSDQDDIWLLNKIEHMVSVFQNNHNIKAINTGYYFIDGNDNLIKNRHCKRFSDNKKISPYSVFKYNLAMGCTIAFDEEIRETLLKKKYIYEKSKLPHDWVINIIAAKIGGLFTIKNKLIYYRLHDNNTLGMSRSKNIESRILAYENMIAHKKAMIEIVETIDNNNEEIKYIKDMIDSYSYRIDALRKKSLLSYLKTLGYHRILKYCNITTVGYDVNLLLRYMKEKR